MSKIIDGLKDAAAVATGEKPAATLWHTGHEYVPATRIRELEAQLASAQAAGVAKGLEMAVNYCRDCAKNFESISASATDQRTAAFSFNQKLTWEGAAENIAALSPPTGMVLVPREKLQRLIDYTVNPTPTNMDDRKALDWVNGQACAMLGATRE